MNETNSNPSPAQSRGRRAIVASALALALMGGVASQALLPGSIPAQAQNLSERVQQPAGVTASFADVIDTVKPAVVSVRVKSDSNMRLSRFDSGPSSRELPEGSPLERFFRRFEDELGRQGQGRAMPRRELPRRFGNAQGSGFFVSADGYVVTNNHVVSEASEVEIGVDSGETYPAKVVGTDSRTDLALLKIDSDKTFPFVKFASAAPRVGDWVVAVGNPFGLGGTVTAGIVSARGRDIGAGPYDDFLQIDAAVNRGNSGGPTFNLAGEVVGVNTAIFSPSGGNVGIAFAIPAEVADDVVTSLKDNGSVTRGWIGVQIQPITADLAENLGIAKPQGALVAEAQADSPAAKAGIKSGDAIIRVGKDAVANPRELARKIAAMKPGSDVELTLVRDGKEMTLKVKLGELPEQQQAALDDEGGDAATPSKQTAKLGIQIAPASAKQAGAKGVEVVEVDPEGAAAGKLREGDVILELGNKPVSSTSDVTQGVRDAEKSGKKSVLMRVKSGEGTRFVAITIGRG
jgi:serine protease Do